MKKAVIGLGIAMLLSTLLYWFLSSNLVITGDDGIRRDGLGREIVFTFVRDWTDKAVMIGLFFGGAWVINRGREM